MTTGVLGLRAPIPTLSLTGVVQGVGLVLRAPIPRLALAGISTTQNYLRLATPVPALGLVGATGVFGSLALTTPIPRLQLFQGSLLALRSAVPTVSLQGVAGVLGTLQLRVSAPALQLAGRAKYVGGLQLGVAVPKVSFNGFAGVGGRLALTAPTPRVSLGGVVGSLGHLAISAPRVRVALAGSIAVTGAFALLSPFVRMLLAGRTASGLTPTTLAAHTERQALSQYTNFPFNSFAQFNGTYLGASDGGIFELVGDNDNGADIAAVARTGITDFGTSFLKRVPYVYVGYRTSGECLLRVMTDETGDRSYRLSKPATEAIHGARVKLGLGLKARYWQFEMSNVKGCDLTIDTIEVKPTKLPRRVGGRRA